LYRHHRLLRSRAELMIVLAISSFPVSALAFQQHGGARGATCCTISKTSCIAGDSPITFSMRNRGIKLLAQRKILGFEILLPQRAGDGASPVPRSAAAPWDVVVGARVSCIDRQLFRPVGGHKDATGGLGSDLARLISLSPSSFGRRKSVSSTSKDSRFQQIERLFGVFGQVHVVAILQSRAQPFPGCLFIVHYQHPLRHALAKTASLG